MKMKPEYKKLWLENLRNGNYIQGFGYLRKKTPECIQYCALGVLEDCINPNDWCFDPPSNTWHKPYSSNMGISKKTFDEVFTNNNIEGYKLTQITFMNDKGYSFNFIANWIENNF